VSDFKAKMHQNRLRLGLGPRPRWGSLQRSHRPPSCLPPLMDSMDPPLCTRRMSSTLTTGGICCNLSVTVLDFCVRSRSRFGHNIYREAPSNTCKVNNSYSLYNSDWRQNWDQTYNWDVKLPEHLWRRCTHLLLTQSAQFVVRFARRVTASHKWIGHVCEKKSKLISRTLQQQTSKQT